MSSVKTFEELFVWQKARILSREIYILTQSEKFTRDYKLKDQINASAGSIMDNIAEGFGRGGNSEFIYYLSIANGSNMETKSQLMRAYDRCYLSSEKLEHLISLIEEISKMLYSLISSLKKSEIKGIRYKKSEE